MTRHSTADIRNLAFIGGPNTGKTTLSEAILHRTGAIKRMGSVEDGTTVSDHHADEKAKGHSLSLGMLHAEHGDFRLHLFDCPGYPDFIGEAACGLAAAETAVLCVNVNQGITFPGRKLWELAGRKQRARCIVLTHIDQTEFDMLAVCEELGEALKVRCVPVVMPDGTGKALKGVRKVSVLGEVDPDLAELKDNLIEAAVEVDEAVMTRFLEEDIPPTGPELAMLVRRSMASGDFIPVLAVSPTTGHGVEEFLAFVDTCMPAPADGPFYPLEDGTELKVDAGGATAFVIKIVMDPFVGKLSYMRVVTGELHTGSTLKLARTGKSVKLAHLQQMQGKDHHEIEYAVAGDLVAVSKLEDLHTSDTLTDVEGRVLAPFVAPRANAARAVEPEDHGDEIKLSTALRRAAEEDPTFTYERPESTGELVVHGVSIVHLETILERIRSQVGIGIKVSIPRVALKETVSSSADGHHRHKKQSGGRGQFAEVFLKVSPAERGAGLVFSDDTVGGSVPKQFVPAIEKGVREVMAKGVIAGYPVVDVAVSVVDGKFHDVDSDEASFRLAGGRAFKEGFLKARPVLLEPLLDMEIAVPSRFMGAITSDLTGRRGQISGMDAMGDVQVVKTRVPQREVMTYPTVLQSITSGEGSFTSDFHDYEIVPSNVQQEIMAAFQPHVDED